MQDEELTVFILEGLSKSHDRDDIITGICGITGLTWEESEDMLERVQAENQAVVVRRQFPLMFIVALTFFIAGFVLAAYGIYAISLFFSPQAGLPADLTTYFMPIIEHGLNPLHVVQTTIPAYFKLFVFFLFSPFSAIFFGIAMIIGSLVGMQDVWAAILHWS